MPSIQYQQNLYSLREGDNLLGADPQADIRLLGLASGQSLGISVESIGAFAWSVGDGTAIRINGRPLDEEAVPLFQGDRLDVGDSTLVFLEDGREPTELTDVGLAPASSVPGSVASDPTGGVDPALLRRVTPPAAPEPETVAALRRLDNQQLHVLDRAGFRIGREKRCDLIIADPSVSRLHAEITFSRDRYLLRDLGRTGTLVNGERIEGPYTLKVGDVIQVADYEFAFLRRPADSPDVAKALAATPVRGAVPDAPTMMPAVKGRAASWILILLVVLAAGAAVVMLG